MTRACISMAALFFGCARAAAPDVTPAPPSSNRGPMALVSPVELPLAQTTDAAAQGHVDLEAQPPPLDPPTAGRDFVDEARAIFRVAACGPSGDIPARFDASVVSRHCEELARAYDEYRKAWVDVAEPFLTSLRPAGLPSIVVYPFGGGDLVSALATFPDAVEITTISLEPAGDVRPVATLPAERLASELAAHRGHLERLFEKAHSRTDNLEREAQAELPGEVVFAMAALVVHGAEPVSLRYFRLQPDGSLTYVSQADIDAQAHHPKALRALFDNTELRFRKSGDASAPVRLVRHIAANLDDDHLRVDPALLAHLGLKGKVAAMTKAASHLLWSDHFSLIRGWLLAHTDWMISDSTGIPPRFAEDAGFTQDTYGTFDGPAAFGLVDAKDANDIKMLFASEPSRNLAFRYGYPDKDGHAHLIVTRRSP